MKLKIYHTFLINLKNNNLEKEVMEDKHQDRLIWQLLFKIYGIKKKLGEGDFSKVYIAFNIETKNRML